MFADPPCGEAKVQVINRNEVYIQKNVGLELLHNNHITDFCPLGSCYIAPAILGVFFIGDCSLITNYS